MTPHARIGPRRLWLVRHGQSQGNVARDAAHEAGPSVIDLDLRDVDVPLSELGHSQAEAAGRWFASLPEDEKPEVLLSSPYIRAKQTAEAICAAGGLAGGAKPTITRRAAARARVRRVRRAHHPGHPRAISRRGRAPRKIGKFYHRAARRRELGRRHPAPAQRAQHHQPALCQQSVLIVCHQVVVLCIRYILEELTEARYSGDRQAGRHPQLRHLRLTISSPTTCRYASPSWCCGTMARRWRQQGTPKTAEPEMMTGSR